MGTMAAEAVPACRRMRLLCFDLLLDLLVADETHVGALRKEKPAELRFVRAVAFRALPGGERTMDALAPLYAFPDLGMAFVAELVLLRHDHPRIVRRVGVVTGEALPSQERIVVAPSRLRLHQLPVTAGAEGRAGFAKKTFLLAPMGKVTGITGPVENRPMHDPFRECGFHIGVTGVAHLVRSADQEGAGLGPVGSVAGGAVPLGERLVRSLGLLGGFCLRMAWETEFPVLREEKPIEVCGMGAMTGEAPLAVRYGLVGYRDGLPLFLVALQTKAVSFPRKEFGILRCMGIVAGYALAALKRVVQNLPSGFEAGFVVALVTQSASLFCNRKRLSGPGGRMAAVALLPDHGTVCAGLQKLPLGGRVGIMAVRAGRGFHGIGSVRLLEAPLPGFVAG